jgi:hypothetical protein
LVQQTDWRTSKVKKSALDRLRDNPKLLAANGVTEEEMAFLETVDLFGSLKSPQDLLFVLKNIREA